MILQNTKLSLVDSKTFSILSLILISKQLRHSILFGWVEADMYQTKGQLISKCTFGVTKSTKKTNENLVSFFVDLVTPKGHFEIN